MPTKPQSDLADSFTSAVHHAIEIKRAQADFEILYKSLRGNDSAFSAERFKTEDYKTSFDVTHHYDGGRPYVIGNMTLDHENPDVIEAKIYDGQYGWQAQPTLIPFDTNSPEHKEQMAIFAKNVAYDIHVPSHHKAQLLRISELAPGQPN